MVTVSCPRVVGTVSSPRVVVTVSSPRVTVTVSSPGVVVTVSCPGMVVTVSIARVLVTVSIPRTVVTVSSPRAVVTASSPKDQMIFFYNAQGCQRGTPWILNQEDNQFIINKNIFSRLYNTFTNWDMQSPAPRLNCVSD